MEQHERGEGLLLCLDPLPSAVDSVVERDHLGEIVLLREDFQEEDRPLPKFPNAVPEGDFLYLALNVLDLLILGRTDELRDIRIRILEKNAQRNEVVLDVR